MIDENDTPANDVTVFIPKIRAAPAPIKPLLPVWVGKVAAGLTWAVITACALLLIRSIVYVLFS